MLKGHDEFNNILDTHHVISHTSQCTRTHNNHNNHSTKMLTLRSNGQQSRLIDENVKTSNLNLKPCQNGSYECAYSHNRKFEN